MLAAEDLQIQAAPKPPRRVELDDLLAQMRLYQPQGDFVLVQNAYQFAERAHSGQVRRSGEPFIQHPLHTAVLLAELQLDQPTIAAGLLHDVPEDCAVPLSSIDESFGSEVARLVDGATKLKRIEWDRLEEQAENLRRMFLAMAQDVRVVLVKLCDRLHNVQTLGAMPPDTQEKTAQETLEIYAPLAHRLGIWELKWRLEDGAFYCLDPVAYNDLTRELAATRQSRERLKDRAISVLQKELRVAGLAATITGRSKHIYSIFRKMQRKNTSFDEIYDLLAVRVLVNNVQDCYAVLGVAHSLWPPIPGQFDDYIAMPKENMYQSLHTAVMFEGHKLEVQIRTHEMHQVADYGIAAHWRYKEGRHHDPGFDAKLAWLRQLMAWQQELATAQDFVESVKMDVFRDQVFVFTPKGEVKDLPAGATPLDFAYRIHTDVGHRCIGAKVSGRLVPLDYELQNGDILEIVTSKAARGPSRDWLNIVRTAHAREKIRQWFKKQEREENVARGKELLEKELKRLALPDVGSIGDHALQEAATQLKFGNAEQLFAALGYGGIGPQQVIGRLGLRDQEAADLPVETLEAVAPSSAPTGGVSVMGVGDLLTRMATCCKPVPGDGIVGFITRGKGITVHRTDCVNITREGERERLVKVDWGRTAQQVYPVTVRVEAWDRKGLLRDVTTVVAEDKLNIVGANVHTSHDDGTAVITATIELSSLNQLSRLCAKLEKIRDVISVARDVRSGQPLKRELAV